jgi:hypothetical protein
MMQTGEDAFMVTFAQRVLPWLSVGANIKILQHQLPVNEEYKGTGIGFDIGLLFKSGKTTTLKDNYIWVNGPGFEL